MKSINEKNVQDENSKMKSKENFMKKIAVLFSHKLTKDQEDDIYNSLKCEKIVFLDDKLQEKFSSIEENHRESLLEELKLFLKTNLSEEDYLLVQGEWGITYNIVNYAKEIGLIPLYSLTKRASKEVLKGDIVEKTSYFKHEGFKKY